MIPLYVALGGAIGSLARFMIGSWVQAKGGAAFPWGTLAVNGLGSLLIGIVLGYLSIVESGSSLRLFLVVGLLGGFTTFSAFSYEIVTLFQNDGWGKAFLYAGGSVLLGVGAVLLGLQIVEVVLRGR